ncbi:MAG: O6-methylguanine-DNA--protein-cysteine methyltransferase, partial [Alphaproteobacteria bacterium]
MQKTHRTTYYKYIKTHLPYCDKVLASANDTPLNGLRLSHLVLKEQPLFDSLPSTYIEHENLALFLTLEHQLNAYAQGTLSQFTIPLDLEGTLHQQKIWALLQQIPYGKTCSYKDIAQKAGSSPRAIGGANRKN